MGRLEEERKHEEYKYMVLNQLVAAIDDVTEFSHSNSD